MREHKCRRVREREREREMKYSEMSVDTGELVFS